MRRNAVGDFGPIAAALALSDSDPESMHRQLAAPEEEGAFSHLGGGGASASPSAFVELGLSPRSRRSSSGRRNAVADLGALLAHVGFDGSTSINVATPFDAGRVALYSSGSGGGAAATTSDIDWESAGVVPPRRGSRHSQRRDAVVDGGGLRDALARMSDGSLTSG